MFYNKQQPKVIQDSKYKDFSSEAFMHELESTLSSFSQIWFGTFKNTVDNITSKTRSYKKEICSGKSSFIHK